MILFGKYLLNCGALTRPQLLEATQAQVIFGGRLGTNLVEMGYLQIDELEHRLGEHLELPVAPQEWLEDPSPEALDLVSAEMAADNGIVPLALKNRTLHLAMSDPRNSDKIDDSAFTTGLHVEPYVVSELRMVGLLERHYGIRCETRSIPVGPELTLGRHTAESSDEVAGSKPAGLDSGQHEGSVDAHATQELIDEETFATLHTEWQTGRLGTSGKGEPAPLPESVRAAPCAAPESASEPSDPVVSEEVLTRLQTEPDPRGAALAAVVLESALANSNDRSDIGRLALQLARLYSCASALFVVRDGLISGFRGDGEAIHANIDSVLIPANAESIFTPPATGGQPWRGQPPSEGVTDRVLKALRRRDIRQALVLPIAVRDQVINLLYVDNGAESLPETAVAALGALCGCVSLAYERSIVERKMRFC